MIGPILSSSGIVACCAAWLIASSATSLYAQPRPNVLLIVTDDQRPDSIAALGNADVRTPTLDRLIRTGTTFTRAVCAYPICVSSRAELITGCTAFRAHAPFADGPLNETLPRWPDVMRLAGYRTAYVGKWHTSGRPTGRGYELTRGLFGAGGGKFPLTHPSDRLGNPVTGYRGWVLQDDAGRIFPERGVGLTPNISETFAEAAIELLRDPDPRPFFVHVNFTAPHDPRFMPRGYEGRYDPRTLRLPKNFAADHPFDHGNAGGRDERLLPRPLAADLLRDEWAVYYALIEHLDAQIGRMLDALDASGRARDTIVIFTSDHGLALGSHGLVGKQNLYEHTIGVPLVVAGPGIGPGVRTAAPIYLRDLFPTVCEWCSVPIPEGLDGRSLAGALRGGAAPHEFVVGYYRDSQRMIRTDRWKFIRYPQIDREQLFDLVADPDELHDRIVDPAAKPTADALKEKLSAWLFEHGDPAPFGPAVTPKSAK